LPLRGVAGQYACARGIHTLVARDRRGDDAVVAKVFTRHSDSGVDGDQPALGSAGSSVIHSIGRCNENHYFLL